MLKVKPLGDIEALKLLSGLGRFVVVSIKLGD
jgi:hypothetical protein